LSPFLASPSASLGLQIDFASFGPHSALRAPFRFFSPAQRYAFRNSPTAHLNIEDLLFSLFDPFLAFFLINSDLDLPSLRSQYFHKIFLKICCFLNNISAIISAAERSKETRAGKGGVKAKKRRFSLKNRRKMGKEARFFFASFFLDTFHLKENNQ
jgi:hypothetical protein